MITRTAQPVDAVLLIGPTGSGKSPLGDLIAEKGLLGRRSHHLDFGSELRAIHAGPSGSSPFSLTELDFISGVLERGLLLENEHFALARKIILCALYRFSFNTGDLLILNGLPRHTGQARDIASLARVSALIVLDCSEDAVFCRLRDNVGGDRTDRTDDHNELVKQKLRTFYERTEPLIHHYEEAAIPIYRLAVNDSTSTADAYALLTLLAAANPPVSLVAEPPQR